MQTGMNVFIFPGTNIGLAVNIFFSFAFIKVQGNFGPFLDDEEDFLGELSQWLILAQLQMTLLLATGVVAPQGGVGVLFFCLSAALFVAVVVIVAKEMKGHFVGAARDAWATARKVGAFLGDVVRPALCSALLSPSTLLRRARLFLFLGGGGGGAAAAKVSSTSNTSRGGGRGGGGDGTDHDGTDHDGGGDDDEESKGAGEATGASPRQQPPAGTLPSLPSSSPSSSLSTYSSSSSSLRASPLRPSSSSSSSSYGGWFAGGYDYNYNAAIAAKAAPPHSGRSLVASPTAWTTSSSRSASSASSGGVGGGSGGSVGGGDEGRSERRLNRHGHRHLLAHVGYGLGLPPSLPDTAFGGNHSQAVAMLRTNGRQNNNNNNNNNKSSPPIATATATAVDEGGAEVLSEISEKQDDAAN